MFSIAVLLFLLSMIVVGGMGTVWGPLLGAAILMLADEGMRGFGAWHDISLGVILALFVILLPRGLMGLMTASHSGLNGQPPKASTKPQLFYRWWEGA